MRQATSAAAHATANLARRQLQVYEGLKKGWATDLELVALCELPVNIVTSARNALVKAGIVEDSGSREKSKYGKDNIVWRLAYGVTLTSDGEIIYDRRIRDRQGKLWDDL